MGNQSRSKSLSPVPSTSYTRESPGEPTGDSPHTLAGASGQPSTPREDRLPSPPCTLAQLLRPLRQGERLLLTLLAEQCVDALLRPDPEKTERGSSDDEVPPGGRLVNGTRAEHSCL